MVTDFRFDSREEEQVSVNFVPVLRAYIANGYQQNQVLRGPVEGKCVFRCDLTRLGEDTTWLVSRNPAGAWSVTPFGR